MERHAHDQLIVSVPVHGVVTRGPTKPVCEMATPCSERAAHILLDFHNAHGDVRVRTDAQGRYAVRLEPGRYVVRFPKIAPAVVVVRAAMRADFNIDTGIR
ncbi:MAG: hypothetical protein ABUS54_06005 [Actinomycetota bacterium]